MYAQAGLSLEGRQIPIDFWPNLVEHGPKILNLFRPGLGSESKPRSGVVLGPRTPPVSLS